MNKIWWIQLVFIVAYTFVFTAFIFVVLKIIFPSSEYQESYLEPVAEHRASYEWGFSSFSWVTQADINSAMHAHIYKEFSEAYELEKKQKVDIRYIPATLQGEVEFSYTTLLEVFLFRKDILSYIDTLRVFLYQKKADTRWRMKWGHIHMYGIQNLSSSEFLQVFIHEFAHYYDIHTLSGNALGDVTTLKSDSFADDFVSGYALTNQYEDFAETYVYYMLHNAEFLKKSQLNYPLQQKYSFMRDYVFTKNQFYKSSFTLERENSEYDWDITKIPVDIKKFLQYIKDTI